MSEELATIMDACGDSDELLLFECKALKDIIHFKWKNYAGNIHYMGLISHIIYLIVFSCYVFELYVYKTR